MIKICYNWGYTPFPWNNGNWTWSECELIQEICAVWGSTPNPWKMANWLWKECGVVPPVGPCQVWGTTAFLWKDGNWWWSQCSGSVPPPPIPVFTGSLQPDGVDAMTLVQPWLEEPWSPYRPNDSSSFARQTKKKRLIKLICKVRGETYEEEKEIGTYDITVDDIKMVIDAVNNIDLDVKLEE